MNTALIIGASRGLGLGLVHELLSRGWSVIATERNNSKLHEIKSPHLRIEKLDMNEHSQIESLRQRLKEVSIDLLFVNAGVIDEAQKTIGKVSTEEFVRLMVTNALSPMRVIEEIAPLVKKDGSITATSSGLGSVADNTSGSYEVYRASKAALNMLMRSYAAREPQRRVFCMSPGWVKTDMGGASAPLDVATSARGMVETILKNKNPGVKFVDYQNQEVPW